MFGKLLLLCFADDKAMLDDFMKADNYSAEDIAFVSKWIADCDLVIQALKNNSHLADANPCR
ncbi:MAG: hypothetical protein R2825_15385 [Saprospiraceae bacterium]